MEDPWPFTPNGDGPTLELKHWEYDNALPESWIASDEYGTPGEQNGYVVSTQKFEGKEKFSFVIYPNPFREKAVLQVTSNTDIENCSLIIYNVYGKEIKRITGINHGIWKWMATNLVRVFISVNS